MYLRLIETLDPMFNGAPVPFEGTHYQYPYRHIKHSNIIDFIFSEVPTWAQKNYLSTVFSGAISSLKLRFKILGLLTRPTQ